MNKILKCEICGNDKMQTVLDLGKNPLCDDLIKIGNLEVCKEYPIEVVFCNKCKTAHQKFQPFKEKIFNDNYHYRSRFTQDVLNGMENLVEECEKKYGSLKGKTVIDIGCNDGSLLDFFKKKGAISIGVEPTNAAIEAQEKGHKVYKEYFNCSTGKKILKENCKIDFITFTNVFAHIENLNELLDSIKEIMNDNSVIVIENHYLGSVLSKKQFDTFYHEHPRTYSLTSFEFIAKRIKCNINNISFPARYGGNIRVFLSKKDFRDENLEEFLEKEENLEMEFKYLNNFISKWKVEKRLIILNYIKQYGKLPAKAFPGRAAIIIKLLELNEEHIEAVYEKTGSKKIGNYVPGTRIPILDERELLSQKKINRPILNLAWHIPNEIKIYLRKNNYEGKIIDVISEKDFCL